MDKRHGVLAEKNRPRAGFLVALAGTLGAIALAGCTTPRNSPFEARSQQELKRSVIDAARREVVEAEQNPAPVVLNRSNGVESLGIKPEVMTELRQMAGPEAYANVSLPLGEDLNGQPAKTISVSLERLLRTAIERNVAIQFARVGPAVAEAQVVAAEAAFDWTLFSNLNYQNTNDPTVTTSTPPSTFGTSTNSQNLSSSVGLRRTLAGGGRLTVQQDLGYADSHNPGQPLSPNPSAPTALTLQWDQPLLKGLGSDVTQAEIRVARNAERGAVQTLRRDLIRITTDTEKAYWELVQARSDLLILQRLLERGEKVRDQLRERAGIDANSAQIADAYSRVTQRGADVTRAQVQLSLISDRLKALVNDPQFPVGSSAILIPADSAVDEPIKFSLLESIRSALRNRPEIQQSIIAIDDASIRQTVARNGRLPDLNLRLQTKWSALDNDLGSSLGKQFNGNFVDYVVGLSLEYPLGYRKGEADYRRRVLERTQSVLAYRNTIQTTVNEVLTALRTVKLNYQLIDQNKTNRIATANSLRVLVVQREIGTISVERLDLELNRQEALAQAERQEVQALTQYNSALADLFAAMGTTLERNNVQFVAPTVDDVLEGVHGTRGWAGEPVAKTPK